MSQCFQGFEAFGQGNGNNGIFGFNVVGSTAGLNITNLVGVTNFFPAGGQMDSFGNFDVTLVMPLVALAIAAPFDLHPAVKIALVVISVTSSVSSIEKKKA